MSRIKEKFDELKRKNEKALISYIMLGFPNEKATISTVGVLSKAAQTLINSVFHF